MRAAGTRVGEGARAVLNADPGGGVGLALADASGAAVAGGGAGTNAACRAVSGTAGDERAPMAVADSGAAAEPIAPVPPPPS